MLKYTWIYIIYRFNTLFTPLIAYMIDVWPDQYRGTHLSIRILRNCSLKTHWKCIYNVCMICCFAIYAIICHNIPHSVINGRNRLCRRSIPVFSRLYGLLLTIIMNLCILFILRNVIKVIYNEFLLLYSVFSFKHWGSRIYVVYVTLKGI